MAKTKKLRKLKKKWKCSIRDAAKTALVSSDDTIVIAPYVHHPDGDNSFLSIDVVTKSSHDLKRRLMSMEEFNAYAGLHDLRMSMKTYKVGELEQFVNSTYDTYLKRRRYLGISSSATLVLACLLNKDMYPEGGKSINLLAAEFSRLFYNDASHYGSRCSDELSAFVRKGLRDLMVSGIVVQGLSGAFFFKPAFKKLMDDLNISFLPIIKRSHYV